MSSNHSNTPSPDADPILPPGTIVAERYRVEALLGEGAVGVVYRVKHLHMGKDFALKLLRAEIGADDEIAMRFQREAVAAAHIDHVNVAAATDFGRTAEGRFFLVLEHVAGRTLRSVIAEGPLRAERALRIALQIASALVRAHALGIVHRDLKPENVMLLAREGGELVKILDFGIARVPMGDAPGQPMTRMGVIYGTPGYMAPEQALGETIDARADLYALGVILYEMLTGRPPFASDDPLAVLGQQLQQRAPTLREIAPSIDVPAGLEPIVMRLLERSASDRAQTAADVVAALEPLLANAALPHLPTMAIAAAPPPRESALASAARRAMAVATSTYEKLRAMLPERWRPAAPILLVGAALAALVVVAVPLAVLVPRASAKRSAAAADDGARAIAAAPSASMRRALRGGPAALEDLARDYPDDPQIQRELVRAYTDEGHGAPAMRALARLLALAPEAAQEDEMNDALLAALYGTNDAAAAAIRVAEGPLGARGVDVLLECASRAAPVKDACAQSLADPEVRRHASPAAAVLLDLREAKDCEGKRAAAERAASQGDARALAELRTMTKKYGCGRRGRYDCWPCLHKDGFLDGVIARLEARTAGAP